MAVSIEWQAYKLACKDIGSELDRLTVDVATNVGQDARPLEDLSETSFKISHAFNALNRYSIRVYFTVLSKVFKSISSNSTPEHREIILESLLSMDKVILEASRSQYEPLTLILKNIKDISNILGKKVTPAVFLPSSIAQKFKYIDIKFEDKYPINKADSLVKIRSINLDKLTSRRNELQSLFTIFGSIKIETHNPSMRNSLWACQILISQILNGNIEGNELQIACIQQILDCLIIDPEQTPKNRVIKILSGEILWNGIPTAQLERFATEFDIGSVITERCKEVEILHEPPIMCLLNGPIKDQVSLNIDRLEYWTNRTLDEDITKRIHELINQIINACLFSNVPITKLPKVIENPTPEEIPVLIEDIKCWFSMVESGWESEYREIKDPITYNSLNRIREIALSSLRHFQNEVYKGKRLEYKRLAAALNKTASAMSFYSDVIASNIRETALFCNDISPSDTSEKDSELYSLLARISSSLKLCPLELDKVDSFSTQHKTNTIPDNIRFTDEITFNTIIKKVVSRFKNPDERSLHNIGHTLKIFKDFAHDSYQVLIDDALDHCDALVKQLQESPGDSIIITKEIQSIYEQYKQNRLESPISNEGSKEAHNTSININVPVLIKPDHIPDELWDIFNGERETRVKALVASIPVSDFEVILRNVHSLSGIHKQLGFARQQAAFRLIEDNLNATKSIPKTIVEEISDALLSAVHVEDSNETIAPASVEPKSLPKLSIVETPTLHDSTKVMEPDNKNVAVNAKTSKLVSYEDQINKECAENFEMLGLFINEAEDIYSGLKQQAEIQFKDKPYLLRSLHTLKGSSAMVGLKSLSNIVHNAEEKILSKECIGAPEIDEALAESFSALNYVIDSFGQEPVTINKTVLRSILQNNIIESQIPLIDIPLGDELDIATLLNNEHEYASAKSTISVPYDAISNLIQKLATIENELYQASKPINAISERSMDQLSISARQLNNTISLNRNFSETAHEDLVASEKELLLKSLSDDSLLNQSLVKSQFEDCRAAISSIESISNTTRDSKLQLQSVLDIKSTEITDRLATLVERCNSELGMNVLLNLASPTLSISKSIGRDFQIIAEHIVRNSFSHAFDMDTKNPSITFSIEKIGAGLRATISDNGKGINTEQLKKKAVKNGIIKDTDIPESEAVNLIFEPGLSVNEGADNMSGRGVGMDVVYDIVSRRNGTIDIINTNGAGLTFNIDLPDTSRSIRSVVVGSSDYSISLPLSTISNTEDFSVKPGRSIKRNNKVYRVVDFNHIATEKESDSYSLIYLKDQLESINIAILCRSSIKMKNLTPIDSPVKIRGVVGYANVIGSGLSIIIDPIQILSKRIELLADGYRVITNSRVTQSKKRVLVIDDSYMVRVKIASVYEKYGFKVDFAENGQVGLKMVKKQNYDLISSDVEMPFVSGFDFVRSYHEMLKNNAAPVFMVTSRTSDRHRALSEKIGVDVFISKHEVEKGIGAALEKIKLAS